MIPPTLLVLGLPLLAMAQYSLVKEYSGSNFFDGWMFYNNFDNLTNGDVFFVSSETASQDQLAFVNSAGNAIIKVDNSSTVTFNNKRNSVRIKTDDRFGVGSVWIVDMLHTPFGCSVWPAWWSQGPDWPAGGEIDTFEGVNQVTMDQMSLHTNPGCSQVSPVQTSTLVNSTDCSIDANNNQGCTTTVPSTASYGAGFAAAGGGIFITEYATSGISIWFYGRSAIPSSLQGNVTSVNTSALGTPVANWPTVGCSISQFFQPQELIFDITLCGDFAGDATVFNATCPGTVCYDDWVVGPGSNYDNAYFEVQSVRVYGTNPSVVTVGAALTSRPLIRTLYWIPVATAIALSMTSTLLS